MKTFIILSATTLISTAAIADDNPSKSADDKSTTSTQAQFEALDRNDDKRLSKSEASADDSLSVQFASLDANADGYINKKEYRAGEKERSTPQPYE